MNIVTNNKWIGQRTIRPDGVDKVTGRAAFAADTNMPGMIWGKVLRSPHAHARIKSIDTSKAERLPGVKAVVTSRDIVDFPIEKGAVMLGIQDMRWMCRNIMARDKALFPGHPVAAVAATTEAIAAEACKLIEVDYEVLPFAIEIDDALKADAPILHEWNKVDGKPSNIVGRLEHKKGDIAEGFAKADVIIERTFTTRPVHQGYIEPHACLISVAADGKTTIWSSSQGQFMVRAMTAYLTGIPQSDIRAIPAEIGGGFGGKTIVYLEPLATLLAKKSGRPVKMVMTREEVMRATGPTSGSKSTVKIGATKDGKIVAAQGTFYLQAGAFPGSPIRGAAGCSFAPYDIPHALSVGYDVCSNRSKVAAYRAPGAPIGAYATGTDAIAGRQDWNKIRYADDTLNLCVQGATHWDALGHIFYEDKAYNGYDAKLIDAKGLNVLGIEHSKNKMVGRGVLLDIARFRGVDWLKDGEAISNDELDQCAKKQKVEIGRGDFVIIRTGQMERCLEEKQWGGYAGGDAPGVKFENCYWCQHKEIAAICTDTWGVEVRPNESTEANQPWHWVVIPAMGLCMGEIFYLKDLARDCAEDGVYEFFFCGPPLIITGGTGSPINPQAIK